MRKIYEQPLEGTRLCACIAAGPNEEGGGLLLETWLGYEGQGPFLPKDSKRDDDGFRYLPLTREQALWLRDYLNQNLEEG